MGDQPSGLAEPPASSTAEEAQDRRLIRLMLPMTPQQRLQTLANWARLAAAGRRANERAHDA